eukprot:2526052-Pyramimonas_sp.AAC.2
MFVRFGGMPSAGSNFWKVYWLPWLRAWAPAMPYWPVSFLTEMAIVLHGRCCSMSGSVSCGTDRAVVTCSMRWASRKRGPT